MKSQDSKDRTILHCDMNGFYASVELLDYPELRDKPMAVCGSPDDRHGIILAKNEIAKGYGIVTAETLWQARKKCPDLQVVPPHHSKYKHYSRLINELYLQYTDQVEPFSVDESWLDVTASLELFGSGEKIADEIRKRVREKYNLTLSAGVSFNKIFAKMGSDYKKPDATTVITRDNFKQILWPLEIGEMFFVGAATAARLRSCGINTIGDLAQSDKTMIMNLLGKHGAEIHDYANGLDESPVLRFNEREPVKSIGHGNTFSYNLTDPDEIRSSIRWLSDAVASRLRKHQVKALGIKLDIKDANLKTISRQKQLDNPTNITSTISDTALEILAASWPKGKPIRMLTITGINLCDENESHQMSLFASENQKSDKGEKSDRAMDDIRKKFGSAAISFGSTIRK